jgi:NTE family protein
MLYKRFLAFVFLVTCAFVSQAQRKVGLVLSGGGADGLAHVGLLKALEEENIHISYITGSSMGALVGGLYASGYSPEEMEEFFLSDEFLKMVNGQVEEKYQFQWAKGEPDPTIITLSFAGDSIFKAQLPTNLIDPEPIDYELMTRFSPAEALAKSNFDSLLIPFRCVAADIVQKKPVVFDSGNLSMAIRASMSYPFFIKPIQINGNLMFDGGLYNNFPSDIMCEEFHPDFIIGSKVTTNGPPPDEDDLYSQVRALLVNETNFDVGCTEHLIVEPKVNFGVFEFEKAKASIDSGYYSTKRALAGLQSLPEITSPNYDFKESRRTFKAELIPFKVSDVIIDGTNNKQATYAKKVLLKKPRKDSIINQRDVKTNFFRLSSNQKVSNIYPTAQFNKKTKSYHLKAKVKTKRDLVLKFGGNFASRPVSHGFVAAQYNHLGKIGIEAEGSATFGKLYAAGHVRVRLDFPWRLPFYFEPYFIIHRWDYFESRQTSLFTDEVPSYIVTQEQFGGSSFAVPIGNRGILSLDANYFGFIDEYYQSKNFTPADTTDESNYEGYSIGLRYAQDNTDYKQYSMDGKRILISTRFVNQTERYEPGSTSTDSYQKIADESWFQARIEFENYFPLGRSFSLGFQAEAHYSGQPLFNNYTSSIIRAQAFQPTIDSKTLFLESFRANQYGAFGAKLVYQFFKNWQIRAEAYIMQPYQAIEKDLSSREASYGIEFDERVTLVNGSFVYKSPIGPFSVAVNYYYNQPQVSLDEENPVTFLFNYGFIIFNRRALR